MERILTQINSLLKAKDYILIAIDGRCGAGKTTLARALQEKLACNVIHMDDFFLRPEQRTKERLDTPGENVDHERFLAEVLLPLSQNKEFQYRPFDCKTGSLSENTQVFPNRIAVAEGSYSCHARLWDYYDLHIFADIDPETQLERIIARNGKSVAEIFKSRWIPLEEAYFEAFSIRERCEIIIKKPSLLP